MAEVLLTHSYFLHLDPKQTAQMTPYPPLAALYVASVLRRDGHRIHFYDTQFTQSASDAFTTIDQHPGKLMVICDDGFNYLTKMCLVYMREACFALIKRAKQSGKTVIVSSSDATDHWQDYLKAGADYLVIGEAELTFSELVQCLDEGKDPGQIDGLAYLQEGQAVKTTPRKVLTDLDSLPFPAWDLVDMEAYKSRWIKKHGYFSINIATTRGCPFKCNWCAKPIYGNRYQAHSASYVAQQVVQLVAQYGIQHIWFCDDIFGLKPGWIHAYRAALAASGIRLPFKIQCRADLLLNESNIADLAAAGCDEVWIGAESGSQQILDAMDKGTTLEQIAASTQLMKKHGIKPCFFLQFGYPGETEVEIQQTIDMMLQLMPHDIGISVSYPLPGTVFYERVKAELTEKKNWDHSDELAMMFRGTYPPSFYKELHRYVHKLFRKARAEEGWKGKTSTKLRTKLLWPWYAGSAYYFRRRVTQHLTAAK